MLAIGPGDVSAQLVEEVDSIGEVITTRNRYGTPGHALSYDRIVVTTEQFDLSEAWMRQLARHGRLVVPFRLRGATHIIAFERDGEALRSTTSRFYRTDLGDHAGPYGERRAVIDIAGERPLLTWDDDQEINPAELGRCLKRGGGKLEWTGVLVSEEDPLDALWLRLAARESGACHLAGGTGDWIASLAHRHGTPAIVEESTLAYLTLRPSPDSESSIIPDAEPSAERFELGVAAYGSYADTLSSRFAVHVRRWKSATKRTPYITAHPPTTSKMSLPRAPIIDRPDSRIVITC
ncbi:class I SAM-dependent methyltransferase [Amycolatopsis roodepoortensis]|uniref:hypothetical protein n=1 Tax=Amycolatopsis roodepoortensis TaxID=700274 RepID=UPI001789FF55|nr:hypothetical protein [Amycolatopsis roodepoortensis]